MGMESVANKIHEGKLERLIFPIYSKHYKGNRLTYLRKMITPNITKAIITTNPPAIPPATVAPLLSFCTSLLVTLKISNEKAYT